MSVLTLSYRAALLASVSCAIFSTARAEEAPALADIVVKATPSVAEKYSLPQTVEGIDQHKIDDTVNIIDTEDALKYLPSLFVRKRNNGDTQPTLATRTWGVNSSARSLVYVDDVPITALIGNNNTNGAPRWGMVSPEAIDQIDMIYGPYAAAYPGNSMGGVLQITTRMPEKFQATVKETGAIQSFNAYKTKDNYTTSSSAATIGNKQGNLSWLLTANYQDSYSQPISFITNSSVPAGTSGTILAQNKTGSTANVVGAGGLLHTQMNNVTGKLAYDFTPVLRGTYSVGYWSNDATSKVQSYLTDAQGNVTYGGVSGFASSTYNLHQQHLMQAASLKTDSKGVWDWEVVATHYDILQDIQRSSSGVLTGTNLKPAGTIARLDGTNWSTGDIKGIWRPLGKNGSHEISFGLHSDLYELNNPTYNTANWQSSGDNGTGTYYAAGRGKTRTNAVWGQDAWKFAPDWKLTLGARFESWQAFDGYNYAGSTGVNQPGIKSGSGSPKASLAWAVTPIWTVTTSLGQAYRYPTVSELYQIIATGLTYTVPNPNLSPEQVRSGELVFERQTASDKIRLSLFQENTANALVSQTNYLNGTYTSYWMNVGGTRNRGIELVTSRKNFIIKGLELSNSVTYVDSKITSDDSWKTAAGTTVVGKHVPYVPDWRDTVQATYRPNEELAFSLAARYSGKQYSTVDNTDVVPHVMGAFDKFFVVDTHVHYQFNEAISADIGIDNIFNGKYFLYHPFPGRTYVSDIKIKF